MTEERGHPASASTSAPHHWLSIVGIGEDGWGGLSAAAKRAVEGAELLYGGARHLTHVPCSASHAIRSPWPSPMSLATSEILKDHRGHRRVTVLASGDPMLYGVGVTLTRGLAPVEFEVIPQVSAFSMACARLGWAIHETSLVSLVSRPIEQLLRVLLEGQQVVIFSENGQTPAMVADYLLRQGYGSSSMHVFESMGGPSERHRSGLASEWSDAQCGSLNVIAFVCVADAQARPLSRLAGLRDDAFESDGQLTKREVRAITLARLAPLPGELLWDVGAGTGTIGIEWMRSDVSCACTAFEVREDRAARITRNARRLGVPGLKVLQGLAPASFDGLASPDAIFLGGGVSHDGMLQACWDVLKPRGRLVVNGVTVESEANLASWHARYGGELSRLLVARAEKIGESYAWRQMMPITQWAVTKP